jgi:hypothetical protein
MRSLNSSFSLGYCACREAGTSAATAWLGEAKLKVLIGCPAWLGFGRLSQSRHERSNSPDSGEKLI